MLLEAYIGRAVGPASINQPPLVFAPIPDIALVEGQTAVEIELGSVFGDPDLTNMLTYELVGQPPSWATIAGSTLTLAPEPGDVNNGEGAATITVRATDDGVPTLFVDDVFDATVAEAPSGDIPNELRPVSRFPEKIYPTSVYPADGGFRKLGRGA